MIVYVLFDKVSKQFTPTFEQPTKEAAIRALRKDTGVMASYEDFLIIEILRKYDLTDVEVDVPGDFDWDSVIRCNKKITAVPLKDFLDVSVSE